MPNARSKKRKPTKPAPKPAGAVGASASNPLTRPGLSRRLQAQLGERLRAYYDQLAFGEQPVPDRFIEIIGRLDHGHAEKRS
jgi:hypothetical protein